MIDRLIHLGDVIPVKATGTGQVAERSRAPTSTANEQYPEDGQRSVAET
jgi:hypothetical protein